MLPLLFRSRDKNQSSKNYCNSSFRQHFMKMWSKVKSTLRITVIACVRPSAYEK